MAKHSPEKLLNLFEFNEMVEFGSKYSFSPFFREKKYGTQQEK